MSEDKSGQQLWGTLDLIGNGMREGAAMAESVHRGIAEEPFNVLDRIPVTAPISGVVRMVHHHICTLVYGSVKLSGSCLSAVARAQYTDVDDGAPETEPDQSENPRP